MTTLIVSIVAQAEAQELEALRFWIQLDSYICYSDSYYYDWAALEPLNSYLVSEQQDDRVDPDHDMYERMSEFLEF